MCLRKTVLHMNMLKRWKERIKTVNVFSLVDDLAERDEKILDSYQPNQTSRRFSIGSHLSASQKTELNKHLQNKILRGAKNYVISHVDDFSVRRPH
jgi:hypothetical protein